MERSSSAVLSVLFINNRPQEPRLLARHICWTQSSMFTISLLVIEDLDHFRQVDGDRNWSWRSRAQHCNNAVLTISLQWRSPKPGSGVKRSVSRYEGLSAEIFSTCSPTGIYDMGVHYRPCLLQIFLATLANTNTLPLCMRRSSLTSTCPS